MLLTTLVYAALFAVADPSVGPPTSSSEQHFNLLGVTPITVTTALLLFYLPGGGATRDDSSVSRAAETESGRPRQMSMSRQRPPRQSPKAQAVEASHFSTNNKAAEVEAEVASSSLPSELMPDELYALYALYDGTGGQSWNWLPTADNGPIWNFTTSSTPEPCLSGLVWQGLNCTCPLAENFCTVNSLILRGYNLVGKLPSAITLLMGLTFLDLSFNSLTGPLPILTNFSELIHLSFTSNKLSGRIHSFDGLTNLAYLHFENNALEGPLPSLSPLTNMIYFHVSNNLLSGTVPSLGNLSMLGGLYVDNNRFISRFPSLRNNIHTKHLHINNNLFTGTLPYLGNLTLLDGLYAEKNKFTGSLENVFNASVNTALYFMNLGANRFTGTIPDEIFKLPSLATFSVVQNCLKGPLPYNTLCSSSSLETLLLDGMHAAPSCQLGLFERLLNPEEMHVQLDPCLFSLPQLQTLQMSGNRIDGPIPSLNESITNRSLLVNLALSYNYLNGVIPSWIQKKTDWVALDLSYNRLSGELNSDFTASFENNYNSSLYLNLNRLSGAIPRSLYNAFKLTILNGNIFSCGWLGKTIPKHDPEREEYSCGSNEFDGPFFLLLILTGFVSISVMVIFLIARHRERIGKEAPIKLPPMNIDAWLVVTMGEEHAKKLSRSMNVSGYSRTTTTTTASQSPPCKTSGSLSLTDVHCSLVANVRRIENILGGIRNLVMYNAAYLLCILTPVYIICGIFGSNYTFRYTWTLSTSYISGTAISVVLFIVLASYVCYNAIQYNKMDDSTLMRKDLINEEEKESIDAAEAAAAAPITTRPTLYNQIVKIFPWVTVILVNIVIVSAVNMGYVLLILYRNYRSYRTVAQLSMAFFKYLWNNRGTRITIEYFTGIPYNVGSVGNKHGGDIHMALSLYLTVVNNVILPCLVVIFIEPDCFYNFLVPPPQVKASLQYTDSLCNLNGCSQALQTEITSFQPEFSYSFQCSASFTTHYAPVFLNLAIVAGICEPLWELGLLYFYLKGRTEAVNVMSSSVETTISPLSTTSTQNQAIGYHSSTDNSGSSVETDDKMERDSQETFFYQFLSRYLIPALLTNPLPPTKNTNSSSSDEEKNTIIDAGDSTGYRKIYFKGAEHLATIVILTSILITFGCVFPPLGVVIVASILSLSYFTEFKLARFVALSMQDDRAIEKLLQVDLECSSFHLPPRRLAWGLMTTSCLFFSFVLFDSLGAAVGFEGALGISILMGWGVPLVLIAGDVILMKWYRRHSNTNGESKASLNYNNQAKDMGPEMQSSNHTVNEIEMGRI